MLPLAMNDHRRDWDYPEGSNSLRLNNIGSISVILDRATAGVLITSPACPALGRCTSLSGQVGRNRLLWAISGLPRCKKDWVKAQT